MMWSLMETVNYFPGLTCCCVPHHEPHAECNNLTGTDDDVGVSQGEDAQHSAEKELQNLSKLPGNCL